MNLVFRPLGIYWLLNLESFYQLIERNVGNPSLYIAAIAGRFVVGSLLLFAAKESRYPTIMKVLGGISIVAAVVFLITGQASFQGFISPIVSGLQAYNFIGALLSIAFGVFFIYAFAKKGV